MLMLLCSLRKRGNTGCCISQMNRWDRMAEMGMAGVATGGEEAGMSTDSGAEEDIDNAGFHMVMAHMSLCGVSRSSLTGHLHTGTYKYGRVCIWLGQNSLRSWVSLFTWFRQLTCGQLQCKSNQIKYAVTAH